MDAGNAVAIRHLLHRRRRARAFARLEIGQKGLADRVNEADVRRRIRLPRLAHDALHRLVNARRVRAPVVHRELDKEKVRPMAQHVLFQPKDAEVRPRAADRGVDLDRLGHRVASFQPLERFHPPARRGRDAPAQIGDADFAPAAGPEFCEDIRNAAANGDLGRFPESGPFLGESPGRKMRGRARRQEDARGQGGDSREGNHGRDGTGCDRGSGKK